MLKFYAGVGARSTPISDCERLTKIAAHLESIGFTLRSGGAAGADSAFEAGVSNPANKIILRPKHCTQAAEDIVSKIHPAWWACDEHARRLHGRNAQIVLGQNLDTPCKFLLAWTLDGVNRGGTRTGLVLAKQHNIPVFNLALREDNIKFGAFLLTL